MTACGSSINAPADFDATAVMRGGSIAPAVSPGSEGAGVRARDAWNMGASHAAVGRFRRHAHREHTVP